MTSAYLEFRMKRGSVNLEDIDDSGQLNSLIEARNLASDGKFDAAIKKLPKLFFEWIPINGDGDISQIFTNSESFRFDLTPENSDIRIGVASGELLLTIAVGFSIDLVVDMNEVKLSERLDEHSMYFCGYVGGGWAYHGDEGCSLSILKVE